jgi:hypothetical protein
MPDGLPVALRKREWRVDHDLANDAIIVSTGDAARGRGWRFPRDLVECSYENLLWYWQALAQARSMLLLETPPPLGDPPPPPAPPTAVFWLGADG